MNNCLFYLQAESNPKPYKKRKKDLEEPLNKKIKAHLGDLGFGEGVKVEVLTSTEVMSPQSATDVNCKQTADNFQPNLEASQQFFQLYQAGPQIVTSVTSATSAGMTSDFTQNRPTFRPFPDLDSNHHTNF